MIFERLSFVTDIDGGIEFVEERASCREVFGSFGCPFICGSFAKLSSIGVLFISNVALTINAA